MKKLLAGCLVVVALGVVVAVAGSYLLYRAASPFIEDARSYLSGMAQLEEIERDVAKIDPYTPPPSGELTEEQVLRFARVQQHVRASLGQRMREIEEKYQHLKANAPSDARAGLTDLLSGLKDISSVYVHARRYQVDALNKEGFSQEEYSWVRDRMYQAAGLELSSRIDLQKLEDAVRRETGAGDILQDRLPRANVPPRNRELVKPYIAQMQDWLPLLFFGL